jgi:hypothetical protein
MQAVNRTAHIINRQKGRRKLRWQKIRAPYWTGLPAIHRMVPHLLAD